MCTFLFGLLNIQMRYFTVREPKLGKVTSLPKVTQTLALPAFETHLHSVCLTRLVINAYRKLQINSLVP